MYLSNLFALSAIAAAVAWAQLMVPVPWYISDISIGNVRHGTGGFWSFNIVDTPTHIPQGFNTTCYYYGPTTYIFALDDAPYKAPCANPNVTFGLFPNHNHFTFNITHKWGNCGTSGTHHKPCVDNGTWKFSWDDVRGQEVDVQNNFGQSGSFNYPFISMYPKRAVESLKCEFC